LPPFRGAPTERACGRGPSPGAGRAEYRLPRNRARENHRNPPCPSRRLRLFPGRPSPRPAAAMPEPSPSAEFLDTVTASVRDALAALDRHEASLPEAATPAGGQACAGALGRLEENLSGWQAILGD